MSRIPGASPITTDIEAIRRSGRDEDRSLVGDDRDAVPEPSSSEGEHEQKENDFPRPTGDGRRPLA